MPNQAILNWEIPKIDGQTLWSVLYRKAQTIAKKYSKKNVNNDLTEKPIINDYSIIQNSLEHVFLSLTLKSDSKID